MFRLKNEKVFKRICAILFLSIGVNSCLRRADSEQQLVLASNSIIGDVLEQILGYSVEESSDKALRLEIIIPRGENNHSFVPLPSTARMIEDADLFVINGLGLENNVIEDIILESKVKVLDLSESITSLLYIDFRGEHEEAQKEYAEEGHEASFEAQVHHHNGIYDPHHWLTPLNIIKWVEAIVEKLVQLDKGNEDTYMNNAAMYIAELQNLHEDIADKMSSLSTERRNVLVGHEAITYYASEYGLNVLDFIIESDITQEDGNLSRQQTLRLGNLMSEKRIAAIIVDKSAGEPMINFASIIAEMAPYELNIVPILVDTLEKNGSRASSYIGYMRYNTELIFEALSQ